MLVFSFVFEVILFVTCLTTVTVLAGRKVKMLSLMWVCFSFDMSSIMEMYMHQTFDSVLSTLTCVFIMFTNS